MAENTTVSTNDERAMRREKRQALLDAGVNPYPIASNVTSHVAELADSFAALEAGAVDPQETAYYLAGRIRAKRGHGKLMFLDLQDHTGQIQLFCRVNNLDEATWALAGSLDVGDIVEAHGSVMRTKRGELSLMVAGLRLLSKSLRPLPEKFHGLSDREMRYRQRYVDLIMNPEVKETFVNRSRIISAIRHYMEEQGYLEVETPILQETLGGANAKPFTTHFNVLDQDCYLRIATELHLKRCIVGGMERVFEVGRQFRNEGMDLTHNPEFTSMEAYCAYSDLQGMKELSEGLFQACAAAVGKGEQIEYQGQTIDLSSPWRSAPMHELVSEVVGEQVSIDTPVDHLRELMDANELEWDASWGAGKLIFELYDELCEKTIVNPTFVCDYPVEVSPLAKRKDDDPRLTDRFELVVCGKEYANAFSELNDPVDQESRFAAQVAAKAAGDDEAMEYDYDYVRALEYGMPPAGGIGYGIDRMIMLFCDQPAIRDVLLFPHLRPERREGASMAAAAAKPAAKEAPVAAPAAKAAAPADAATPTEAQPVASIPSGKLDPGITREAAFELLKQ
ncbi:MAG: lysine--tRNA ligase, partial [Coriobacteriales bacterium]|nr:lysine--tRNA ligase [Coriobacteriales bacterium]